MKKYLIAVVFAIALTACQSCNTTNPNVVPIKYGYGIPVMEFKSDTGGLYISLEDEIFADADLNAVADSILHHGYTFQSGGFTFWIGPRPDSIGHIGVKARAKMKLYVK